MSHDAETDSAGDWLDFPPEQSAAYSRSYASAVHIQKLFRDWVAIQIAETPDIHNGPRERSVKAYHEFGRLVNETCKPFSLTCKCPKDGHPSRLYGGRMSNGGPRLRFMYQKDGSETSISWDMEQSPHLEFTHDEVASEFYRKATGRTASNVSNDLQEIELEFLRKVDKWTPQLPENLEQRVALLQQYRHEIREWCIDMIGGALNSLIEHTSQETPQEKRALCKFLNSEIGSLGLAVQCPITGEESYMVARPQSTKSNPQYVFCYRHKSTKSERREDLTQSQAIHKITLVPSNHISHATIGHEHFSWISYTKQSPLHEFRCR